MRNIKTLVATLFVMACSTIICGADDGLVAHCTFDEGAGAIVKDTSGNGHDGKITGATYVKSPRGHALSFDGVDDVVDFGADASMILSGNMTLMIWVKTNRSEAPKTHRVLFGDAAGTIDRNLNLRIDHQNRLRFEWGNGKDFGVLTADSAMLDGAWKHLALVCDWKARLITLYVNAQPFAQGEMPIPISKTNPGKRFIGAWGYGCFKGEIDDIRLYNRALPEAEIERIYASEAGEAKVPAPLPSNSIRVLRSTAIEGATDAAGTNTLEVGPACTVLDPSAGRPQAVLCAPIRNRTGKPQSARIVVWKAAPNGGEVAETNTVALPVNGAIDVSFDRVDVKPLFLKKTNFYISESRPKGLRIAVSAPEVRSRVCPAAATPYSEPLRIVIPADPWRRDLKPGKTERIALTVDAAILDEHLATGELTITLASRERGDVAAERRIAQPTRTTEITFDTKDIPWGAYDVNAAWKDASGRAVVAATALATVLPGGEHQITPLNNLVTELMDAKKRGLLSSGEIAFMNPRDGWCFFSVEGDAGLRLDPEEGPMAAAKAGGKPAEAMRRLPAGRHTLRIAGAPTDVIVRAIPALVYNVHEARPLIAPFGPHTWERINRTILPQCNIIESNQEYPEEMKEWRAAGKDWVTHAQTPGLLDGSYACTADQAYECWRQNLGYTSPLTSGIQADEVIPGYPEETLCAFAESIGRLHDDPRFSGRTFIPFVVRIHEYPGGMLFMKSVLAAGWPFSIELYLAEQPTEELDRENIKTHLIDRTQEWEDALPGSLRSAIITLMYAVLPYCTTNTCPTVDFKVHLDMQMQALATDPLLFGLYGVQPYRSNYTDEETLRWMGKLLRHYCIEGQTERLWKDPYLLTHIKDPDFEEGLAQWETKPAEEGSIAARTVSGYGAVEGRYPASSRGDAVAILKRSAKSPNALSQEIRNLEVGRLYSLKMITADYQDFVQGKSRKDANAVTVRIDGVDMAQGSFQHTYPNARGPKQFMDKSKFWMNYHWHQFRARGPAARLTITDWKDEKEPGGPIGQELMINDIEIQPVVEE